MLFNRDYLMINLVVANTTSIGVWCKNLTRIATSEEIKWEITFAVYLYEHMKRDKLPMTHTYQAN